MKFLKKYIPDREQLKSMRLMRPFAALLDRTHLWHTSRRSVANAVAIGLFFGLLIPVGQIFFAAAAAIALRANIAIAAGTTLITNPLTFPPIYYAAYRVGDFMLGVDAETKAEHLSSPVTALRPESWWRAIIDWFLDVGPSLALGLTTFAVVGAAVGYLAVHGIWRVRTAMRMRTRRSA